MTQPTNPTGTPNGPWHPKTDAEIEDQATAWTPPAYPPVELARLVDPAPIQDPVFNPDGTFTVPLKRCCGALPGDWCDCAEFAAQLAVAYRRPIGRRVA